MADATQPTSGDGTDGGNNSGTGQSGPWRAVEILVERSPTLGAIIILAGLAVYGGKVFLEDKRETEQQLETLRGELATEQRIAREKIEEERQAVLVQVNKRLADADALLRSAADKELEAVKKLAQAEAKAILQVQDTMITTSERVQSLVSRQLDSMGQLDDLRSRAETLQREELSRLEQNKAAELAQLDRKREEVQAEVERLQREARVSKFKVAIDLLKESIEKQPYNIDNAISLTNGLFSDNSALDPSEIETIVEQQADPTVRATIYFALANNARDRIWLEKFTATLSASLDQASTRWLDGLFGCCADYENGLWEALLPIMNTLINDEKQSTEKRLALAQFFERRPESFQPPLFAQAAYRQDDGIWNTLAFLTGVVRTRPLTAGDYYLSNVVDVLMTIDIAVTHVWADALINDDTVDQDVRTAIRNRLDLVKTNYPVITRSPSADVKAFWKSEQLYDIRHDYAERGTSGEYVRQ